MFARGRHKLVHLQRQEQWNTLMSNTQEIESATDQSSPSESPIKDTSYVEASQAQLDSASQQTAHLLDQQLTNNNDSSRSGRTLDAASPSLERAYQDTYQAMEYPRLQDIHIAVVVPPVERRWEFQIYEEVPIIDKVVRESEKTTILQYLVIFYGGRKVWVSTATD